MSEEETDPAERFRELQEQAGRHPGRAAKARWDRLGVVARMVFRNQAELLSILDVVEENEDVQTAMFSNSRQHAEMQEVVYAETYRLLHNYLAAVKTMVEHSRNLVRTHYLGTPFQKEYDRRVKDIAAEPVSRFIQDLRNVLLHHELPGLGTHFSFKPGEPVVVRTTLSADRLLENERWTKPARAYIASKDQSEGFGLRECVAEYAALTESLSTWLRDQFPALHADDVADHDRIVTESWELLPRDLWPTSMLEAIPLEGEEVIPAAETED